MARRNTATKPSSGLLSEKRSHELKLIRGAAEPVEAEPERLELAYGGGWESFDSDDVDALRAGGAVGLPK